MDRLKEALEAIGLKCGGTLEQRADRLFSVKGKAPEDIDRKLKVGEGRGQGRGEARGMDVRRLLYNCCNQLFSYFLFFCFFLPSFFGW